MFSGCLALAIAGQYICFAGPHLSCIENAEYARLMSLPMCSVQAKQIDACLHGTSGSMCMVPVNPNGTILIPYGPGLK